MRDYSFPRLAGPGKDSHGRGWCSLHDLAPQGMTYPGEIDHGRRRCSFPGPDPQGRIGPAQARHRRRTAPPASLSRSSLALWRTAMKEGGAIFLVELPRVYLTLKRPAMEEGDEVSPAWFIGPVQPCGGQPWKKEL